MGVYTLGTPTAIAYRGDTLEVTELGLERGIRYVVIKGVRGVAGAAGQRPADRPETASLNGSTAAIWQSATLCDAARCRVVMQLIAPLHAPLRAAGGRAQQPATAAPCDPLRPAMAP